MKHWPVVLALVLVLVAGLVALRREPSSQSPSKPPSAGPAADPQAPVAGAGPTSEGAPPLLPPVKPRETGSLKCVLIGDAGAMQGILLVLGDGEANEASRPASGEGRVEITIDKLTKGPKRVVFLPERTHAAVSAEAVVPASAVAEVTILLKAAGTVKGKVVDSLQRPVPSATVEMSCPAVFAAQQTGKAPVSVWGEGGGRSGGRGRPP